MWMLISVSLSNDKIGYIGPVFQKINPGDTSLISYAGGRISRSILFMKALE